MEMENYFELNCDKNYKKYNTINSLIQLKETEKMILGEQERMRIILRFISRHCFKQGK